MTPRITGASAVTRTPDRGHVAEAPNFTPKRTGRASEGWAKRMGRDGFEVENKVPYVGYLEKPYVKSKKAPNGIIGPTLTSVKGKLR